MSTQQSIATVTYLLRARLQQELDRLSDIQPLVQIGSPLDPTQQQDDNIVRIYLHQVIPNTTLRNSTAAMEVGGRLMDGAPILALDLHYLMTFHGMPIPGAGGTPEQPAELAAQRMLGQVVQLFHRQPTLGRDELVQLLGDAPLWAVSARVEEQLALLHLELQPFDLEVLSKLWSVLFQLRYSLSVGYVASVLLVETDTAVAPAPAVRTRNLHLAMPTFPRLSVLSPPQATIGDVVTLRGHGLDTESVSVLVGGGAIAADTVGPHEVTFTLPPSARAGGAGVSIVHTHEFGGGGPHDPPRTLTTGRSNTLGLVIVPTITAASVVAGTLQISVSPAVARFQRPLLSLLPPDDSELRAIVYAVSLRDETDEAVATIRVPIGELPEAPEVGDPGFAPVARRLVVEIDGVRSEVTPGTVLVR